MTELLTVRELAIYLKLNPATVMRKASKGELPAIKIGRQFRFDKKQIDDWLTQKMVGKQLNILVVDDEQVIGNFFKDLLTKSGYQVIAITNGRQASELVAKERFDIIFLDLVMPEMDGPSVLKSVRQIDDLVPIVIITGYPDSDLMQRAMEQGPLTVLRKPLEADEVRKTINSLTGLNKR